jgi:hypothetical protein
MGAPSVSFPPSNIQTGWSQAWPRMPLHRVIHQLFDPRDLSRVFAKQPVRYEACEGLHAFGMRNHIVLTTRRELSTSL